MPRQRRPRQQLLQHQLPLVGPCRLELIPIFRNHPNNGAVGAEFPLPVSLGRRDLAQCWWKSCPNRCLFKDHHRSYSGAGSGGDGVPNSTVACEEYCKPIRKRSRLELLSRSIIQISADNGSNSNSRSRRVNLHPLVRVTAKNPNLIHFHYAHNNNNNQNHAIVMMIIGEDWMRFQLQIWWQARTHKGCRGGIINKKPCFFSLSSDEESLDGFDDEEDNHKLNDMSKDDDFWSSPSPPLPPLPPNTQQQLAMIEKTTQLNNLVTRSVQISISKTACSKRNRENGSMPGRCGKKKDSNDSLVSPAKETRKCLFPTENVSHDTGTNDLPLPRYHCQQQKVSTTDNYDMCDTRMMVTTESNSATKTNGTTTTPKTTTTPSLQPKHLQVQREQQRIPGNVSTCAPHQSKCNYQASPLVQDARYHSSSSKAGDVAVGGRTTRTVPTQVTPAGISSRKRPSLETRMTRRNGTETPPPTACKRRLQYNFTQHRHADDSNEEQRKDSIQALVCTNTTLSSLSPASQPLRRGIQKSTNTADHDSDSNVASSSSTGRRNDRSATPIGTEESSDYLQAGTLEAKFRHDSQVDGEETSHNLESQLPKNGKEPMTIRGRLKLSSLGSRKSFSAEGSRDAPENAISCTNGEDSNVHQDHSLLQSTVETTVEMHDDSFKTIINKQQMNCGARQLPDEWLVGAEYENGSCGPYDEMRMRAKTSYKATGESDEISSTPMLILPGMDRHCEGVGSGESVVTAWGQSELQNTANLAQPAVLSSWVARERTATGAATTTPTRKSDVWPATNIRFCFSLSLDEWKNVHIEAVSSSGPRGKLNFRGELSALILEMNQYRTHGDPDHSHPSSLKLPSLIDTSTLLGPS